MASTKPSAAPKAAPKATTKVKAEKAPKSAKVEGAQVLVKGYVPSLCKMYKEEIIAKLTKEFGYTSVMQVPKLTKITINQGVGAATGDKKLVEVAQQELTTITGQKAMMTYSRMDISNFKLRKGMPIGVKVTLRSAKMYEFLERLIRYFTSSYQRFQRY